MKKFKVVGEKQEHRYRNIDVCEALGVSSGMISGFMRKAYGTSSKGGMTIEQIIEFINAPHKDRVQEEPDMNEVNRLMDELHQHGFVIDEEEQLKF